ncbi:MAG: NUDIX hydrolase [Vulcanimicrobiaceae bacterium]
MRFADGNEHQFDIIEHPGSVGIIATTESGGIVLVRQYRPAIGRALWEIPAGKLDGAEDPLVAAARELREETGFRAGKLAPIGALYTTPGFCDEFMHFIRAEELTQGADDPDDDEFLDVAVFSLAQAHAMLLRGEIADVKTVYAMMLLA